MAAVDTDVRAAPGRTAADPDVHRAQALGGDARPLGRRALLWLLVGGFGVVVALGGVWAHGLLTEYAGPVTASGHHDFLAFYSAAELAHAHQAQSLYDAGAVTALERAIFPHATGYAGYMPFINPPAAAVVLAPLAALPFSAARWAWFFISLVLAIGCSLLITFGRGAAVRALGVIVVLATFPTYQALVEGQWSLVILLGCLAAIAAAGRGHDAWAGAALAVLWLKPPLLVLVLVWLLVTHRWRAAAAMLSVAVAVSLAALPWTGLSVNLTYGHYLAGVFGAHLSGAGALGQATWEGALPNMEGLIGLAAAIFGQRNAAAVDTATVLAAMVLTGMFARAMRSRWTLRPLPLRLQLAAVCLGLLLDPHLYPQDCVLLLLLPALVFARHHPHPGEDAGLPSRRSGFSMTGQVALLLGTAVLLDLSAVDALWVGVGALKPIHALTVGLVVTMVVLVARPAGSTRWRGRGSWVRDPATPLPALHSRPGHVQTQLPRQRPRAVAQPPHAGSVADPACSSVSGGAWPRSARR